MAARTSARAPPQEKSFFHKIQVFSVGFGAAYLLIIALLTVPAIQSHAVYANRIRLPWFAKFDIPEKYGLSPGKTLNLKLNTSDNVTIGAWFILSDPFYHALTAPPPTPDILETYVEPALKAHPTVLFFHGNSATRALKVRVQHYTDFSSRLRANVLAIDYRGYGDSEGSPSEVGLARDARAAWDWLIDHGAKTEDVLIVGHSLGTAVATKLGVELGQADVPCRGVVLLSPFSSVKSLLHQYSFFGIITLFKPVSMIPGALNLLSKAIYHHFDTLSALPGIKAPLLIAHSTDDTDIPHTHAEDLYNSVLAPFLPLSPAVPLGPAAWGSEEWAEFASAQSAWADKRKEIVTSTHIPNFGVLEEFHGTGRKTAFLKTSAGVHVYLGVQGGVQDVIRNMFLLRE